MSPSFGIRSRVEGAVGKSHWIVDEKGIKKERIIPVGMGEDEPLKGLECNSIEKLATNQEKEAAHQRNRRTDCKVESWDYVPEEEN